MQDGASGERNNTSESLALQETRRRLVQAMSVGAQALVSSSKSSSASSPLVEFCQQLAVPLSHISDSPSFSAGAPRRSPAAEATTATSAEELAYWTCQVRMHDALLRVVRNRLLQSTVRLARTSQHWKRRRRIASSVSSVVAGAPSSTPWLQPSARKSASQSTGGGGGGILSWWNRNVVQRRSQWALEVDHDQKTRWAVAQASYMAEAAKLGRVTSVLIQQPDDLDPSHLIVASEQEVTAPTSSADDDRGRDTSKLNETPAAAPPARGAAQWLPRYSMRWVADGKGHVSIRKLDPNPMAWWEDSSGDQGHGNKDHRRWGRFAATLQGQVDAVRHAKAWVHEARAVISQVVQETIETSVRDPKRNKDGDDDDRDQFNNNSTERQRLLDSWCSSEAVGRNDSALRQDPEQVEQVWNRIITYCDTLSSWRRPGEGQVVRWWDMAVVGWTRRLGT